MRGSKQLAMMFLLGAVLVGGVLGFTADRVIMREHVCVKKDKSQTAFREQFARDLDLTPAQRVAVDSILDYRHSQIGAVMATVRPKMESIKDSSRAQILRVLNESQRIRFEAMRQEMRNKHNAAEKK